MSASLPCRRKQNPPTMATYKSSRTIPHPPGRDRVSGQGARRGVLQGDPPPAAPVRRRAVALVFRLRRRAAHARPAGGRGPRHARSEEHTSELQSPCNLVCRLLLEKKKTLLYTFLTTAPSTPRLHT